MATSAKQPKRELTRRELLRADRIIEGTIAVFFGAFVVLTLSFPGWPMALGETIESSILDWVRQR